MKERKVLKEEEEIDSLFNAEPIDLIEEREKIAGMRSSKRRPGRPRKGIDRVNMVLRIDKDIYDYLYEKVEPGHISDFVNETLRSAIEKERGDEK